MDFYEILGDIMAEKSLSIPEVARRCSLADSTVRSIIVKKNKSVTLEVAFKLSDGLDVPMARLNGDFTAVIPKELHDIPEIISFKAYCDEFSKDFAPVVEYYLDHPDSVAALRHGKMKLHDEFSLSSIFGMTPKEVLKYMGLSQEKNTTVNSDVLSEFEKNLVSCARSLSNEGQEKLSDYADDLVSSGKYKKHDYILVDKEA